MLFSAGTGRTQAGSCEELSSCLNVDVHVNYMYGPHIKLDCTQLMSNVLNS